MYKKPSGKFGAHEKGSERSSGAGGSVFSCRTPVRSTSRNDISQVIYRCIPIITIIGNTTVNTDAFRIQFNSTERMPFRIAFPNSQLCISTNDAKNAHLVARLERTDPFHTMHSDMRLTNHCITSSLSFCIDHCIRPTNVYLIGTFPIQDMHKE